MNRQHRFLSRPSRSASANRIAKLTVLLMLFSCLAQAQYNQPYRMGRVKHRLSAGVVMSFFKPDPHFMANTKAKIGGTASYKVEVLLTPKTNFVSGLEFLSQSLSFNGYYAAPGYTYLFDKTFSYTHELRFNELQMPLGFKVSFPREQDRPVTGYYFGGIGFRYILNSYTVITSDSLGISPYDGKGSIGFEHHLIAPNINAFYEGGIGLQKNFRASARAVFFEITYKYGISRIHYTGYQDSNNINIRNNNLDITVGIRL